MTPVLTVDTPLFIDPFLIYDHERGPFRGSHSEILRFFKHCFKLIAQSGGRPDSIRYQKAAADLVSPEVQELCLGYAQGGTKGAGSGTELGSIMAEAIWEAINAGLRNVDHFEEVSILRENIGPDRISDITASILRHRLAKYTAQVCRSNRISTRRTLCDRAEFDFGANRWKRAFLDLPINPYSGRPILLTPEFYLRDLPTLEPDDFFEFCVQYEAETLRREFNLDLTRHVPKSLIITIARRHIEWVRRYVQHKEAQRSRPYDLLVDKKGYISWYDASRLDCGEHPLAIETEGQESFAQALDSMVREFRHYIEKNQGYRLLWNDNGTSRSERAAQLLFLGIIKHYCQAHDIDISETNIGRGPVDFKASKGYRLRILLELKLARNTKFWDGATKQLPAYLKAEQVRRGYFIVIVYTEADSDRIPKHPAGGHGDK